MDAKGVLTLTQAGTSQHLHGNDLLARISTEMVQAQKKYFGKGPTSTKSYMLDDFLVIVMRGCRTVAEQTMLDFGQADLVRNFRQQFENEMTGRLVGMIEEVTGREVRGYQSQILFEPDVVIEIFFFADEGDTAEASAMAHGLLSSEGAGETPTDDRSPHTEPDRPQPNGGL